MSKQTFELKAEARDRVGKGSARHLRRNGMIPAVIYGEKQPPLSVAVPYKDVHLRIMAGGFMTNIAVIDIDGKKVRVLPKDYQMDPVRDFTMHVDFLRVGKNTIVTVNIPVHFLNEDDSPGLTVGGVLNVVRYEIEVNCPADRIPDAIEVDLSKAEVGDSIHISEVKLPDGVTPTITDRDFTIATIAAPTVTPSEEDEAEAAVAEAAAEAEVAEAEDGNEQGESEDS